MSFNRDVKNELKSVIPAARHCQLSEIAAILSICGIVSITDYNTVEIEVRTENSAVASKFNALIRKCFHIAPRVLVRGHSTNHDHHIYIQNIDDNDEAIKILKAVKLMNHEGEINETLSLVDNVLIQRSCCKRAFIRGSFLATGSMSDPEKQYHYEIVLNDIAKAEQIKDILNGFALGAKITTRKNYHVVYVKEGADIVDVLNIMEAHKSLMELENIRIVRDMRNKVNRRVNCETANINKTVSAAVKQIEDIRYIKEHAGLGSLKDNLRKTAELRLKEPEVSLTDLGQMLNPPVGKTGVYHRLRKISIIADELRESNNDN